MLGQMNTIGLSKRDRQKQRQLTINGDEIMNIRPFNYEDADYRAIVAIANAIHPDTPSSVTAWKHFDSNRQEQHLFQRFVAEGSAANGNGRKVVATAAYGHTPWSFAPDKYFVNVQVDPEAQNQGIGSGLYDFVMDQLRSRQPAKLVSFTREDREVAVRFLERRGFRQVMRIPVSRLDSTIFDVARFEQKLARVEQSGIAVKTLRELSEQDADWKHKVYELEWECVQDVPSTDPLTKQPFEQFEKRTLGSPNLLPDAWFVAVDGDRYVGLSVLWKNLTTDRLLETGLTGVVRSHRRRSIATAMKVRAIQYAQTHGGAAIVTDNEENNPMFQLNLQLGFEPQPAHLDFELTLDT